MRVYACVRLSRGSRAGYIEVTFTGVGCMFTHRIVAEVYDAAEALHDLERVEVIPRKPAGLRIRLLPAPVDPVHNGGQKLKSPHDRAMREESRERSACGT